MTIVNIRARPPWSFFVPAVAMSARWVPFYNAGCAIGAASLLVSALMFIAKADNGMMPVLNGVGMTVVVAHFAVSMINPGKARLATIEQNAGFALLLFASALINGLAAYFYLF